MPDASRTLGIATGFRVFAGPSELGEVTELETAGPAESQRMCVCQPTGGELWIPLSAVHYVDESNRAVFLDAAGAQEIPDRGWNKPPL